MDIENVPNFSKKSKLTSSRLKLERDKLGWTQSELAERIGTTQVNVSRWEKNITTPSPYYRQKLRGIFGKSFQELGFISESIEERSSEEATFAETSDRHTSPIWNVPYRRNPFFTGRDEILTHLYTVLQSNKTAALTQAQAISGLGGIGKTQVALEYAYRYQAQYQALLWINASSRDALTSHFVMLATLLNLPEQQEKDQDIVVRAVKRWLSEHTHWLLILDNVDKLEMIEEFLPIHSTGDILITTRLQALGTVAQSIEVEKMGLDEGVVFLLRRAKVLTPSISPEQVIEENQTQAKEIVAALDGLPLALDQAGAYIEETRCGLSEYLSLYGMSRRELLLRRGKFPLDHPASVTTTWSLSFQQIEQESLAAADLLRLLAFLNPEAIPEEIIMLGSAELGPALEAEAGDPLKINTIIELLLRYSLVRRAPEVKTLHIHRLVQVVLKDSMSREAQQLWVGRAIRAVNQAFPNVELQNQEKCQRILPHVQVCTTYIKDYELAFPEAAHLFHKAATYLIAHADYSQAGSMLLIALSIRHQLLEANHPVIAGTLNDLGELYLNQGEYKKAETQLQEALAIRQRVLGEEHLDIAQTLYNLASLYRTQGAYVKAEPFYLQALHIREKTLGTESTLVAQSYYGLAKLYYSQGNYYQAEELCKKSLYIREQLLGKNAPEIASTLNILAKIYQGQNQLDQAKKMNLRALQIREGISGKHHPQVAVMVNNLVEIYHAEEKYREADILIDRALNIHEEALGLEHPYTAYSLSNRAENFFLRGNYVQAENYYKKVQTIREKYLGIDHPHTASTYYELAKLYIVTERYEEAEIFSSRALSIRKHAFGYNHPSVISTLTQHINLLRKMNKEREANELEIHIQEIRALFSTFEKM